ncbi:uncharacterized protein LOC127805948 [Diospyros lotus]|uniref:uncharacterized protein LOC127805948 n=1 Tax=Diospyros lotus TaxID=55363 RepID=UPI002256CDAA|nr:uncharacterized protein LOC127805948 [Diospyros lotus]
MAESTSGQDAKAPNLLERTKEEIEATLHAKKLHHHRKESRVDIDENTPIEDVKGPNVFERVQEEIEAIVQTIHPKKEAKNHGPPLSESEKRQHGTLKAESKPENPDSVSQERDAKSRNLIERAKEELDAMMHKKKPPHRHHKETHGMSNDIDEHTAISEIKGPNAFERAKEEIEALVETIHRKKESRK